MSRAPTKLSHPPREPGVARGSLVVITMGVAGLLVIGAAALVLHNSGPEPSALPEETRLAPQAHAAPEARPAPVELPPLQGQAHDAASPPATDDDADVRRDVVRSGRPIGSLRNASPTATNQLTGRVIDAITKEPVSLFTVHCLPAAGGDPLDQIRQGRRSGQTFRDREGRFRVASLERGQYAIVVDAPDYKKYTRESIDVPGTSELAIELSPGAYIDGKLSDMAGRPVPNISIFLNVDARVDPKLWPRIRTRKTNAQGYFKFSDLPPGVFSVSLERERNPDPGATSQDYSVQQEQHVQHNFTMPLRNTALFTISDERGVLLNGAHIRLYDREGHQFNGITDQSGEAQVPYVPDGNYTLKITCRGYVQLQENVPISGGAATVPIRRVMRKEP
ncbi:MAG: carboxypeptidase-like regulatory domain-containing protein [Planctomycetota bacterium]